MLDHSTFMDTLFKDFEFVEKVDLTAEMKSLAREAVAMLQHLKALSSKCGVPLEEITAKDIVQEYSRWATKARDYQEKFDYWIVGGNHGRKP